MTDLRQLPTPCFLIDRSRIERIVNDFKREFTRTCDNVTVGYSVKTNSLPYLLSLAGHLGCMCEVVSFHEYELAKCCGFSPSEIIYNGPMKSRDSFVEVIKQGGIVNIETHREVEWLESLPHDKVYDIGLRVNINLSLVSPENASGADDTSRFGFSYETGELGEVISRIKRLPYVRISGLHLHRTTHNRGLTWYGDAVHHASEIVRTYALNLKWLDTGGGYNGTIPTLPKISDYADIVGEALSKTGLKGTRIIVEPGSSMLAWSMKFITEVIDVKKIADNRFIVNTDGSRNDIDPFWRKKSNPFIIDYTSDASHRPVVASQIIGGYTCLEDDRIAVLQDSPLLKTGDRLIYENTGAYTLTLSPMFIRMLPAVFVDDGNEMKQVQRARCGNDIIRDEDVILT